MNKSTVAIATLALCAFTGTATADSLSSRAATTLGAVIAAQGNAALVQIRKEIAVSALTAVKPLLPEAQQEQARKQPAKKHLRPAATPIQHSL
ncbi:MAG: hypothetical protein ACT4PK_01280 [Gammaproteobacteria bacterium]